MFYLNSIDIPPTHHRPRIVRTHKIRCSSISRPILLLSWISRLFHLFRFYRCLMYFKIPVFQILLINLELQIRSKMLLMQRVVNIPHPPGNIAPRAALGTDFGGPIYYCM